MGSALAGACGHVGLELVVDGGEGVGLVLGADLMVDVLVVDGPELVLGVVGACVEQLGTEELCASQLQLAVELDEGFVVVGAAAVDTDGEDALVSDLGDTGVEAGSQADLTSGLARSQEDLELGEGLVDELDELSDGAGGDTEVLHDVLVGQTGLVQGLVAGTAVHEGVGETAGDEVLGHAEVGEGELATPESTMVVAEEVVGQSHVDLGGVLASGLLVEVSLHGVGEPVHLHLLESTLALGDSINEPAQHDADSVLLEVDTVNEVDRLVACLLLEDAVGRHDILDKLQLDLDVLVGGDKLDSAQGDNTEGTQATGGVLEEVGVVFMVGSLEGAVTKDNLDLADGVAEKTILVHAALSGEARESTADGDTLELHDNLGDNTLLDAVGGEDVHGDLGLALYSHGLLVDGEDAVHVAGVDDLIAGEGHGTGRAGRAMVDTEGLLLGVEVLDPFLNAGDGLVVLLHERGLLGLGHGDWSLDYAV